jgi:hypothetical protein
MLDERAVSTLVFLALRLHAGQPVLHGRGVIDQGHVPGLKFSVQNCRLLYADIQAGVRAVLAVGVRDEHAIYRMAVERITAREEASQPDSLSELEARQWQGGLGSPMPAAPLEPSREPDR